MEHKKSNFDVLQKITDERQKRNWSEYTLAKNSNIAQSTISTWYRKNMIPSVSSIERVCAGFGISLCQFFSENSLEIALTEEQQELFHLWECLNKQQRNAILQMIQAFLDTP